jgi:hypothetical protein
MRTSVESRFRTRGASQIAASRPVGLHVRWADRMASTWLPEVACCSPQLCGPQGHVGRMLAPRTVFGCLMYTVPPPLRALSWASDLPATKLLLRHSAQCASAVSQSTSQRLVPKQPDDIAIAIPTPLHQARNHHGHQALPPSDSPASTHKAQCPLSHPQLPRRQILPAFLFISSVPSRVPSPHRIQLLREGEPKKKHGDSKPPVHHCTNTVSFGDPQLSESSSLLLPEEEKKGGRM